MALLTTTIGSYPKPDYLPVPDWFRAPEGTTTSLTTASYTAALAVADDGLEELFVRAIRDTVRDQVEAGIDLPTDGEMRRENYIHYHCRHLDGIDFARLSESTLRNDAYAAVLPTVTGPISAGRHFLPDEWRIAQSFTDRPVKTTIPGPLTITDTVADEHYHDPRGLGADLAAALNYEILALAKAGCRHIQVDEPVFARIPRAALDYGMENLERCFDGCPDGVRREVHICCGYPDRLDSDHYPKAPPESYFELASAIEQSSIHAVSLEDAHRHNDLSLLERFSRTTVILGVVAIARSRVEPVAEIVHRLEAALAHIDAPRLMAAPDCGLAMLGRELALEKLANLVTAARAVG